jgi:hypothetical protein
MDGGPARSLRAPCVFAVNQLGKAGSHESMVVTRSDLPGIFGAKVALATLKLR